MLERNAFALDFVDACNGNIQEQINQMVLEQIHFIDVEKAAIGTREQSRFERLNADPERALNVDCAADAVFGGAQRQVYDGHGSALAPELPFLAQSRATVCA